MNRLQRIQKANKLKSEISTFLAIAIGTFMFWLLGFAFYNMVVKISFALCEAFQK